MSISQLPKVSVVIPTYNCDRFIEQAIISVFQQTYTHWEIIVIDDGSTDRTQQVLQPYDDQINYIYQTNQGVAHARNQGIHQASGELIAFLDADDYFFPSKLADQVALFQAQPHLGFVNTGWRMVNSQGEPIDDITMWTDCPNLDLESLVIWKPVLPSVMMIKKQWLKWVGGFDARFPPVEDIDLVWRLALMGCPFAWLTEVTVGYRQHQSSAIAKNVLKVAKSFDAVVNNFFSRPDLPPHIKSIATQRASTIESVSRYRYLIWLAWRFYEAKLYDKMADYLLQSYDYSAFLPSQTIANWLEYFTGFGSRYGSPVNIKDLCNLPAWQKLVNEVSRN